MNDLLVVGGGIAAVKTIEAARDAGYTASIVLASEEDHLPYDRPPLSKEALGATADTAKLALWDKEVYSELDVDLRLGARAVRLDRKRKIVHFHDGSRTAYGKLVIATGARARPFPGDTLPGVHTIRTIEDARAIAALLAGKPNVVVIGAGFIGAEVASTARGLGCTVTILEAAPVPLVRALGPVMGRRCASLHQKHQVRVLTNQRILGFTGSDHVMGVVTGNETSAETIPASLVVVGIGSIPNTEWLGDSGLDVSNGVLCDACGHADGSGNVFAVGDVSSWIDTRHAMHHRHEHWTAAVEQAKAVGYALAGKQAPSGNRAPYFWSDQHGTKIQMIGTANQNDRVSVLQGDLREDTFLVAYHRDNRVSALLAFAMPRLIAQHRKSFVPGQTLEEVVAATGHLASGQRDPAPLDAAVSAWQLGRPTVVQANREGQRSDLGSASPQAWKCRHERTSGRRVGQAGRPMRAGGLRSGWPPARHRRIRWLRAPRRVRRR